MEHARHLAEQSTCVLGFRELFHNFGFIEVWREPADEEKYPTGKVMPPKSAVTADPHYA